MNNTRHKRIESNVTFDQKPGRNEEGLIKIDDIDVPKRLLSFS